ncbi:DOPA-like domain-containing protein [Poronia punctata]|nr:DOPA-like domain-containing protein [Poronia punctata]
MMPLIQKYTYPSPLAGYENATALPEERKADGKSYVNLPSDKLSDAYEKFPDPIDKSKRGGFDVHIYYYQTNKQQKEYAKALWERIRREFPELEIYSFWDRPIGPHPVAMFEVNLHSPAEFGAFIPWLAVWRGPLSALIHPNTDEEGGEAAVELRNHSERAIWMGERIPLDFSVFVDDL